jgi:dTDP-4-dehydrorhamnose 3,5-epimerase
MIFTELKLPGVYLIKPEELTDDRGFFARTWCQQEFRDRGLVSELVQCNVSFNHRQGTLRGMHYQATPHAEVKLLRCTMGAIYDVLVDLRPTSATFRQWTAVELTAHNHHLLYVPEGIAHGLQTLVDDTEIFYQMSAFYVPEAARGVRWNDPIFGIEWPLAVTVIADRDRQYPDFQDGSL